LDERVSGFAIDASKLWAGVTEGKDMALSLPYFDDLIERIEKSPDSALSQAFQRHVHWGYFSSPEKSDNSLATFLVAAEEMSERVCRAGRVRNGARILDVGCGMGGTIAHLNEHLSGCQLVGLNIDERQLAHARETVKPLSGNTIQFVHGDACAMPFEDDRFDVVLALECIFHFPSRKTFFSEAHRVLKRPGTLAISDFVIDGDKLDQFAEWTERGGVNRGDYFGPTTRAPCTGTYERLGRSRGFDLLADEDITAATLPTYDFWARLYRDAGLSDGLEVAAYYEEVSKRGFLQYRIVSFEPTGR
jgi:SAM-dependent methyltransferase